MTPRNRRWRFHKFPLLLILHFARLYFALLPANHSFHDKPKQSCSSGSVIETLSRNHVLSFIAHLIKFQQATHTETERVRTRAIVSFRLGLNIYHLWLDMFCDNYCTSKMVSTIIKSQRYSIHNASNN